MGRLTSLEGLKKLFGDLRLLKGVFKNAKEAEKLAAENLDTATKAVDNGATDIIDDAVSNAKDALKNAGDSTEKAAKNLEEAASTLENTRLAGAAEEAGESAATRASKADEITKEFDNDPNSLDSKLKERVNENDPDFQGILARNPGKTFAAALVASVGIGLLAAAIALYDENNNKQLTILDMESADDSSPLSNQSSNQSANINLSPKVIITFDPSTKISPDDKIVINNDSDMLPQNGGQLHIDEILSDTKIKLTIHGITNYATQGTMTLKTTFKNCLTTTTNDAKNTVTSGTSSILGDLSNSISNTLGPYLKWVLLAVCGIICITIFLSFIK
jgi:hypothetical protein